MEILSIQVLQSRKQQDVVLVETNLPSPMPALSSQNLTLEFKVASMRGLEYCKENFPGVAIKLSAI